MHHLFFYLHGPLATSLCFCPIIFLKLILKQLIFFPRWFKYVPGMNSASSRVFIDLLLFLLPFHYLFFSPLLSLSFFLFSSETSSSLSSSSSYPTAPKDWGQRTHAVFASPPCLLFLLLLLCLLLYLCQLVSHYSRQDEDELLPGQKAKKRRLTGWLLVCQPEKLAKPASSPFLPVTTSSSSLRISPS